MRDDGNSPVGIVHREPPPVTTSGWHQATTLVDVSHIRAVPAEDLDGGITKYASQHDRKPVQTREPLAGEQPIGEPCE